MKKHIPIILLLCISVISHASLPQYFEINKGESYKLDKKASIKLVETKVESFDSVQNRIQASSVIVEINKKQYQIYCGYESSYIEAGDHRVGVDYIRDYDHIWNNRLKLKKMFECGFQMQMRISQPKVRMFTLYLRHGTVESGIKVG